jgi:tetratricopeptide (TPR) repeat protein
MKNNLIFKYISFATIRDKLNRLFMAKNLKYKAFISYSRRDKKIVDWFHKNLESYKTPNNLLVHYSSIPKKVGKVFKDIDDLSSHHSLDGALKEALEQSEYLIVFCSINSANSKFVSEEIKYFREIHGEENIIPIIINGEPNATSNLNFSNEDECFPLALRVDENNSLLNPLAIDIRKTKDSRKKALIKIVSTMFGIWFDDIWEREKRRTFINNTLISLLIILLLTLISYSILSIQNTKELSDTNIKLTSQAITLKTSSKQLDNIDSEVKLLNNKLSTSLPYKERQDFENKIKELEDKRKYIISLLESFNVLKDAKYAIKAKEIFDEKGASKAIEYLESDESQQSDQNMIKKILEKNNLKASLYKTDLQYEKAIQIYEKNLILATSEFGEDDRIISTIMNYLSTSYSSLGEYKKVKELNIKVLDINKRILGDTHPDTLTSMNNLASVYSDLGEYEKAKEISTKANELSTRIFGLDHDTTLSSMNNLAAINSSLGEYKQAKDLNIKVLEIRKKTLRENHPDILLSMSNLASDYSELGEYEKAKEINLEVLKIRKKTLRENHPDILLSMSNLASDYSELGEYEKAKEINLEVL